MSDFEGWCKVIHESGEQWRRQRKEEIESFDPADLPQAAKYYLKGTFHTFKQAFSLEGNCRFTDQQLLDAIHVAALELTLDDVQDE